MSYFSLGIDFSILGKVSFVFTKIPSSIVNNKWLKLPVLITPLAAFGSFYFLTMNINMWKIELTCLAFSKKNTHRSNVLSHGY